MDRVSQEQLHMLVESAIQAPSADNKHPLQFELSGGSILIHHVRTDWSEQGYKRVLDLLSLGALVENLALAASQIGLGIIARLLPDSGQPGLILRIDLQPDAGPSDPLWQAIPLRHTCRQIWFRGPKLSISQRSHLDIAISSHPECRLHWLDGPVVRRQSIALMRRAETERFRNKLLHEELFSAIRFDVGWHSTCEEGLPPGALAVEPPLRGLFAQLCHWPVMRLANRVGAHHLLGWRSCDIPCRLAPHLGLLAVKTPDTGSVLATGRAFQQLWLTAASQGLVLQPMPASALYALDGAVKEGIPTTLNQTLRNGWRAIFGDSIPLMLFRMGRAPASPITSGRPPADYFLSHFKTDLK
jgi:hypothetical protein